MDKEKTKKPRRRFGDRADGRRVRSVPPMLRVTSYIMKTRNTSANQFRDNIDTAKLDEYVKEKKKKGLDGFNIMYVLIAAHVRMISQYPAMNRFIAGQEIYARHKIEANIVIKKEMTLESPDTAIKVEFAPTDTAEDVYNKMNSVIEAYRNAPESSFDNLAKLLDYIPGFLLKFVVAVLQVMDYFGILPRSLTKLSPFHGSYFITSMGSLGIPTIYHHLYDFGNVPVFQSFGAKEHRYEVQADGSVKHISYVPTTYTMDERIADGFYYATALRYIKKLYRNPWLLDSPPETVVEDIP